MKTTTKTIRQTLLRFIAALLFCLLLAPVTQGQDAVPPSNWKDHLNSVTQLANANAGDGSAWDKAIEIATAEELAYFAQQVNSREAIALGDDGGGNAGSITHDGGGNKSSGFEGYYFALTADIALSDHYWTPIGEGNNSFDGNFDGRGHCVSGLKVKVEETNVFISAYAGLFGNAYNATLQNLGVILAKEGVRASATDTHAYAGGIAGGALNICNCYVVGPGRVEAVAIMENALTSCSYAGGIVGSISSSSSLTHCYATVGVKAGGNYENCAGGIAGSCGGSLSYTYATGAVEATEEMKYYAGGICGDLSGTISNSLALNESVKGGDGESNRIAGKAETGVTLTSNYASPEIQVNGKLVASTDAGDANGGSANLDDFSTVITWGDGWDTSDATHLPQLKMRTDDTPTYSDWPTGSGFTPQPSLPAANSLMATKLANAGGGDGSSWGNAIVIANRAELAYFAQQVNSREAIALGDDGSGNAGSIAHNGGGGTGFEGYYFALSADIDLSAYYWTPIGEDGNSFNGNFDGRGHCVSGLKVKVETVTNSSVYAGLFGSANNGTLRNLGVILAKEGVKAVPSTTAGAYAGGIAGRASNISNCYVVGDGVVEAVGKSSMDRTPVSSSGGIVGFLSGSLSDCYATVGVKAVGSYGNQVGGIAGATSNRTTISRTYATGAVVAAGGSILNYAGGIFGDKLGTISNSLALNESVKGGNGESNRIAGEANSYATLTNNYASPRILVNGKTLSGGAGDDPNGAPTYLDTFADDLKNAAGGEAWNDAWIWTDGHLPQLKMRNQADNGYEPWNSSAHPQPFLSAANYLSSKPLPPPPPPLPPLVYYGVTVPAVDGASTHPKAGTYIVEEGFGFRFYLELDTAYNLSEPVVTTSRGEILKPRESDGAYLVNFVYCDTDIIIEGIEKNNPVANATILDGSAPQIWTERSTLCVQTAAPEDVRVVTASGSLALTFRSLPGVNRRQLPTGFYIVQVGDTVRKVIVR